MWFSISFLPIINTPLQPLIEFNGNNKVDDCCKYGTFKKLLLSLAFGLQVLKHSITGFVSSDKKSFDA